MKAAVKEYKPLANAESKELINDKRVHIIADEEPEKKELLGVNTGIITKSPKLNPFSMEDLQEEPELEECEEEEPDEEDEDEDEDNPKEQNTDEEEIHQKTERTDDNDFVKSPENSSRISVEESVDSLNNNPKHDETKTQYEV